MDNVIEFPLHRTKGGTASAGPAPGERPMLVVEFYRGETHHVRMRSRPEDGDVGPRAMRAIAVEFQAMQLALLQRAYAMDGDDSCRPALVLELYADEHVEAFPINGSGPDGAATVRDFDHYMRMLMEFRVLLAEMRRSAPR